jgi:o-succinylbenzoate---CoA ligase
MTFGVGAAAREVPEAVAIVGDDVVITYRELAERALAVAAELGARGLRSTPPRRVGFVPRVDVESIARVLGCIEVGVPFVPMHPRLSDGERVVIARDADVAWEMPDDVQWPPPKTGEPPSVTDARALAILFTSGTSGRPKGAVLSRRAFAAAVAASEARLPLAPGDRWLLTLPPAHVGGLSIVLRCVAARATIVLGPSSVGFDARAVADRIARDRVTHASLVPTMLHRLLELEPRFEAGALRAILLGGAPADGRLLDAARRRDLPVRCTYGLTEACSQVATAETGDLARGASGALPLPGVDVRIVDCEIEIRGPMLFDGYLGDEPGMAFTADGWFATGDLGSIDDEGRLHVVGRRSDLILSGGENVYPAEVEAVLSGLPGVRAACVFGVPDAEWGERVAVALVMDPGLGVERARSACRAAAGSLASFKRPRWVAVFDELPTNRSGKIDRRAVADRARLSRL